MQVADVQLTRLELPLFMAGFNDPRLNVEEVVVAWLQIICSYALMRAGKGCCMTLRYRIQVTIKDFRTDVALAETVLSIKTFRDYVPLQHVTVQLHDPNTILICWTLPLAH